MTTFREAPGWGTKRTLCRRSINPRPHQCKANRIINRETAAGLAMAAEIIPRPAGGKADRVENRGAGRGEGKKGGKADPAGGGREQERRGRVRHRRTQRESQKS